MIRSLWSKLAPPFQQRKDADFDTTEGFITWLTTYESWYTRSSDRLHRILVCCRVLPLILGFVVAIISALPPGFQVFGLTSPIPRNVVVIALTGITTLCVGVLTQLGVAELARARETGRIGVANLVAQAKLALPRSEGNTPPRDEMIKLKDALMKIEFDQAELFVASTVDRQPPPLK